MMLHHRGGVSFLDLKDILLIQREDRATVLYTLGEGRYVTADTLAEMEERLHSDAFFRCHKSYIVNMSYVERVERDFVMKNGCTVYIRRGDVKKCAEALDRWRLMEAGAEV